jgi:hypothetical protein
MMPSSPTLALLEHESPQAARLAELASLAVRVDAGLLRRLRQRLLPDVDTEAESDLWFSAIVESRSADGFQILPDVLQELRERLATDRAVLKAVREVTAEAHARASPAIKLEETLNAIALERSPGWEQAIEDAFQPALHTLATGGSDARDIARWALRAGPRLHELVRSSTPGRSLLLAAPLILGTRPTVPVPTASAVPFDQLAQLASALPTGEPVRVGIAFVSTGLQFRQPSTLIQAIDLPRTQPLLVGIEWTSQGATHQRTAVPTPGVLVPLAGSPRSVTLTTLTGDQYRVTAEGTGGGEETLSPLPPQSLLRACKVLRIPGEDTATGVAFAVDGSVYLTCAEVLRHLPILAGADDTRFELLVNDLQTVKALRRTPSPSAAVLPLSSDRIRGAERAAVPALGPGDPRWIQVELDDAITATRRRAVIPHPGPDLLELPAWAIVGGPLVIGDTAVGIVMSVSVPTRGDDSMLVLDFITGSELEDALERGRKVLAARPADEPRPTVVQLWIATDGEGGLGYEFGSGDHRTTTRLPRSEIAIADALLKEWQPLSTAVPVQRLSDLLIPAPLRSALREAADVTLTVDEVTARYPWEVLQESNRSEPYGVRFGMVRSLERLVRRPVVATGRRALVIGDTTPTLAPLAEAGLEASSVRDLLESSGWRVDLLLKPKPREVLDAIFRESWSLVHIAGHGVQDHPTPDGVPISGVALDDGLFLTAREFESMKALPLFVCLNASNLGRLTPADADVARTDGYRRNSMFLSLLGLGVRVVIAPAWEPMDPDARALAEALYRGLVDGQPLTGAIREARRTVRASYPQTITWASYHCYGDASFTFASFAAENRAAPSSPRREARVNPPTPQARAVAPRKRAPAAVPATPHPPRSQSQPARGTKKSVSRSRSRSIRTSTKKKSTKKR